MMVVSADCGHAGAWPKVSPAHLAGGPGNREPRAPACRRPVRGATPLRTATFPDTPMRVPPAGTGSAPAPIRASATVIAYLYAGLDSQMSVSAGGSGGE